MNSTSVNTSFPTERLTSSGSAFQRGGAVRLARRSTSARIDSSSWTSTLAMERAAGFALRRDCGLRRVLRAFLSVQDGGPPAVPGHLAPRHEVIDDEPEPPLARLRSFGLGERAQFPADDFGLRRPLVRTLTPSRQIGGATGRPRINGAFICCRPEHAHRHLLAVPHEAQCFFNLDVPFRYERSQGIFGDDRSEAGGQQRGRSRREAADEAVLELDILQAAVWRPGALDDGVDASDVETLQPPPQHAQPAR